MCNILHVSDFHMNLDYTKAKDRLEKLAVELEKFPIDIVVFTGDLIDARIITNESQKDITDKYRTYFSNAVDAMHFVRRLSGKNMPKKILNEYNALVSERTKEAYERATVIFQGFIDKLGITDYKNVVVCCGNHDRLRIVEKGNSCFDCKDMKEEDFENPFCFYNEFCRKLKVKDG